MAPGTARDGMAGDGTVGDGAAGDGGGLACSSEAASDSATFRLPTRTTPITTRITLTTRTTTDIRPRRRIHRPATIRLATRARRDPPLRPALSMLRHRRTPTSSRLPLPTMEPTA